MTSTTRETWPEETPEQMIERVRAEHGDAIADLVARDIAKPVTRRKRATA